MARPLAQGHVQVNAMAAGAFASEMNLWARAEPENGIRQDLGRAGSGRAGPGRVSQAQDIADTVTSH